MKRLDTQVPALLMEQLDILCQVHAWTKKDAIAQALRLLVQWAEAQAPHPTEDTPNEIGFRNECG